MKPEELKKRTKQFAVDIIKLSENYPRSQAGKVISNQLLRCATSVAANYRSACRARSAADFISKITIVEEEADESLFWIEVTEEAELMPANKLKSVKQEADELTAIFTSAGKTAKQNQQSTKSK